MKLSKRISGIVEAGIDGWEVHYRARALRDAGQDITMLSIGDHDQITPEPLIAAMAEGARKGHTGYMPMPGIPALRDAIAARVAQRTGAATTRDNVLVVPGGQAALFAALTAVLDPGDKALFIDPHYATYPSTIRAVSGVPLPVSAKPEHGFQPQLSDLLRAGPAKALLINSPNNPTGVVYSSATMNMIAAFARTNDLWLLSDEVYDGQVWNGAHISPRILPDMDARTLVLNSLSKSHVMTGWRLGWIIGPPDAIARMTDLAVTTTYGVPGFIQDAGLAALTHGDAQEADLTATYRRRRSIALAALNGANGITCVPPDGAMYVMLDVRTTGMSGIAFAEALLDEASIAVMPGESFGSAAAGHVRVALTVEDQRLEKAMQRIAEFAGERVQK